MPTLKNTLIKNIAEKSTHTCTVHAHVDCTSSLLFPPFRTVTVGSRAINITKTKQGGHVSEVMKNFDTFAEETSKTSQGN